MPSEIIPVTRITPDATAPATRAIAVEAPVAIEVNGLGYAVMLATPADLVDFGTGFALTEGLAATLDDVIAVEPHAVGDGSWLLRLTVVEAGFAGFRDRIRHRLTDSGCGLCGLDSLEAVLRPLPPLTTPPGATAAALFAALAGLGARQPLNAATGAVHAAAFCRDDGSIALVREDVGRHNAFDKLIGAMARADVLSESGFALLSSRCSTELVEKAIVARIPLLATISAPTSLAVSRAKAHALTLIALARPDAMLVASDPFGVFAESTRLERR